MWANIKALIPPALALAAFILLCVVAYRATDGNKDSEE